MLNAKSKIVGSIKSSKQ